MSEANTIPLWTPAPEAVEVTNMTRFMDMVTERFAVDERDYPALWEFSIEERPAFWDFVRKFTQLKASDWGTRILVDGDKMPGAKWFPDARLNYAENLLVRRDDTDALVFRGEDKVAYRLSWNDLYDQVSVLAQAMRDAGIGPGDRIGGYMPNMPETIVAMLATTSIGAVWSSCSPDFGVQGVLDRFGQIEPRMLITVDGYHYNGKSHDLSGKVTEIIASLPTVSRVIIVPYVNDVPDTSGIPRAELISEFTADIRACKIEFEQLPFDHPLYIMFSSGTTGVPKCIVHGAGGTLIQHAKEQMLHCDMHPGDRVFYFTTCGWMMWNWLVGALAQGGHAVAVRWITFLS